MIDHETEHCTSCSSPLGESQIGECDDCQDLRERPVKVVVLCNGGDGPVIHTCEVRVTDSQKKNGDHYTLAKENAEDNGFEEPMMAFDAEDPAATQLASASVWLNS